LLTCRLANDGSNFVVTFDVATDRGNLGRSHACSVFFEFRGVENALCFWQDHRNVKIFPTGNSEQITTIDNLIEIGDVVAVKNFILRAQCPAMASSEECSKWLTTHDATCDLAAPVAPLSPIVSISAPSLISQCKSYTLDLTASSGGGGRPWKNLFINVSSESMTNESLAYRDEILTFYQSQYSLSPPTAMQSGYLMGNETYIFEVTLCNFLLKCHTGTTSVQIKNLDALPVVTIAGSSLREIHRSDSLSLISSAYIGTCSSANRFTGMTFKWQVSENGGTIVHLVSESRNPFRFKLSGGKLSVGSTYRITLAVTDSIGGGQSFSSVTVVVIPSDVVAVIAGGASNSWRIGDDALTFDGSGSYDMDRDQDEDQSLTYLWTCDQDMSPVSLEDTFCSSLLPAANRNDTKVTLNANFRDFSSVVGASVYLTLRVDGSNNRSDSATVSVTVAESTSPKITIIASLEKINSVQPIKIFTSVQVTSTATAVWSMGDRSIDMATIASIPSLSKEYSAPGQYTFNLVISGSTLQSGSEYDFILSVSGAQGFAMTSITVQVVEPPRSGELIVFPSSGVELSDLFQFSTSRWTDDELPLSYSFGYFKYGNIVKMVELQERREFAFMEDKYLPRGAIANGFNLSCGVFAFNALDASSTQVRDVKVNAIQSSPQEFEIAMLAQLEKVSGHQDINSVKSVVSVGVSILNTANCSLAPRDCGTLGREPCSSTPHTCGPCLDEYIGESTADGNSECYAIETTMDAVISSNGTCVDNADCQGMQSCREGLCSFAMKTCPSDCSGNGVCQLEIMTTGATIDECQLNDFTCQARCICNDGYLGSGCSETESAMHAKRQTRYKLIEYINSTLQNEDASSDSLTARVVLISDLGSNPSELTKASCSLLQVIIIDILASAVDFDVPISKMEGLLQVLQNCDKVHIDESLGGGEEVRLSGVTEKDTSTLDNNRVLRSKFSILASDAMAIGESNKEFIESFTRITLSKNSISDMSEQAVPQTSLEKVFSREKSRIACGGYDFSDTEGDFTRSVFLEENDQSLYANSTNFTSNPLKIKIVLSSLIAEEVPTKAKDQTVLVTIQNSIPQFYSTNSSSDYGSVDNSTSAISFITDCAYSDVSTAVSINYTCPSGQQVSHRCTDGHEVITSTCPVIQYVPVCHLLSSSDSIEAPSLTCTLVYFTSTSVVCNCTISLEQTNDRRRLYASSSVESSGYAEVVAMTEYTTSGFVETNKDVTGITLNDVERGTIVIVMFGVLWGCGFIGLYELIKSSYCSRCSKVEAKNNDKADGRRVAGVRELSHEAKKEYLMKYIDEILPAIFRSNFKHDSTVQSLWKIIKNYHPYAIVFTADGPGAKDLKIRKGLYLLTIQAMLMFIMAVFCDIQFPADDGYCAEQTSQLACEARKSMFDQEEDVCDWFEGSCQYKEVEFTVRVRASDM
jgi:hypothetical protein